MKSKRRIGAYNGGQPRDHIERSEDPPSALVGAGPVLVLGNGRAGPSGVGVLLPSPRWLGLLPGPLRLLTGGGGGYAFPYPYGLHPNKRAELIRHSHGEGAEGL
jgi:hypothetical protein